MTFTSIPSGHTYSLVETKVPDGYVATGNTYTVTVAYDATTVTVRDAQNNEVAWNGEFPNNIYFELPRTGGPGSILYTVGGLLLTAAGALLLYNHIRRRKEETISS